MVDPTISHQNMLTLVNADRAATGVGALTWNATLEEVAKARAIEVMGNALTEDFKAAVESGDPAAYSEVVHRGHRDGLGENAIVSFYSGVTEETANQNWIASAGHHETRTRAGYTMYACASYTEPVSGMEVWVEIFQNSSGFDFARYAADYPDLAAAFGNDSYALYNHYITSGAKEGRKAYHTDGTIFE